MNNASQLRFQMVEQTLSARDITSPPVLAAMQEVPRHLFVPPDIADRAYGDFPLPIGYEQTISQPYIVACMAQLAQIEPHHRVLEIGTGSGYGAAILSKLAAEVFTIELKPALADAAQIRLAELGFENVHVRYGDGSLGWPEHQPFDAIVVTAAPPVTPLQLIQQLNVGGRAVIPIGAHGQQVLYTLQRTPEGWQTEYVIPVRFVPMLGAVQTQTTSLPTELPDA